MSDVRERLEKAAEWQKRGKALSWPEKVRRAEAIRESLGQLRQSRPSRAPASSVQTRPLRATVAPTGE